MDILATRRLLSNIDVLVKAMDTESKLTGAFIVVVIDLTWRIFMNTIIFLQIKVLQLIAPFWLRSRFRPSPNFRAWMTLRSAQNM